MGPLSIGLFMAAAAFWAVALFHALIWARQRGLKVHLCLHRVHKSLKEANRQATTVTTEALQWGFWHVGDFSKAYKECFGELPSNTLAREP